MDSALHPIHHQRRRIRYREPWIRTLPLLLLPMALALPLTLLLVTGHVPGEAVTLLRLLALAAYGATGFGLARLLIRLRRPAYVELLDDEVVLPESSLARRLLRVPYASIQSLFVTHIAGQDVLVLRSSQGENRLLAGGFPCRRDFDTFLTSLRRRMHG